MLDAVLTALMAIFTIVLYFSARAPQAAGRHSSVGRTPAPPKPSGRQLARRSPSPTPPTPPTSPSKTRYDNGRRPPVRQHHSLESDDGGYDDEPGVGSVADSNAPGDSETAAETTEYEEADDAASETGTYTIGKDSPSIEEEESRRDIERVFNVLPAPDAAALADDGSRSTPQWIREWAAQVAQQQQQQAAPAVSGRAVALAKPPSHPRAPDAPQQPQQRPRRRLPSVPPTASSASSRSRSSPRPSDMSEPSDSSLETECFLRDTESVVCAMQV